MRYIRYFTILGCCISLSILGLLAGCGGSSSSGAAPAAGTYLVEYVPGASPASVGKTSFQLKVSKVIDGTAATGLAGTIILNPMMDMGGGMAHSAPVDIISESTTTAGTYDCKIYYLMGGTWQLNVTIGSETTKFSTTVGMGAMTDDTAKLSMYGPSDIASGMSGTQYNYFYLFNDGVLSHTTPTFKLYISQTKDNKMHFNPLSVVSSQSGTVESALITASTDSTFPASAGITLDATDDGNGHWSMYGLDDLATAGTYTVYVKMNVEGEDKTTNGSIQYASFKVTSH